jgi:hypothetical protein
MSCPAAKIPVSRFDTTFFWPLTLDADPGCMQNEIGYQIDREVCRLEAGGRWVPEPDLLEHIAPPDPGKRPEPSANEADTVFQKRLAEWQAAKKAFDMHPAESYAEYTYFHDFVQHFLFDKVTSPQKRRWPGDEEHKPIRLLRRTDVKCVSVTMDGAYVNGVDGVFRFEVKRLNLYVLRGGLAMLALELSNSDGLVHERPEHYGPQPSNRPVMLHDVLLFNDRMRRAHAPFVRSPDVDKHEQAFKPPGSMVPLAVRLHGEVKNGANETAEVARQFSIGDDVAQLPVTLRQTPGSAREVPPFQHWTWLINGDFSTIDDDPASVGRNGCRDKAGWKIAPAQSSGWTWRHVADERLPILSAIRLPSEEDYRAISEGDWARLAGVDPPGRDPFPYASPFVNERIKEQFYDRYHYPHGESSSLPTRYLFSPYSLTAVGCGPGASGKWPFFDEYIIENHMRRHYFQLMLLAQIEMAILMSLSSRITLAVSDLEKERASYRTRNLAEERFTDRLMAIEQDLLQYVHRFRFTGVSSQIQPAEMFALLRRQMRLDIIFAEVRDELTTATGFLALRENRRQAKAQESLSLIAGLGVVFGIGFAVLSMNLLTSADLLDGIQLVPKTGGVLRHAAMVSFIFAGVFLLAWSVRPLLGLPDAKPGDAAHKLRRAFGWMGIIATAFGLVFLVGASNQKSPDFNKPQEVQICTPNSENRPNCPIPLGTKP